MFDGYRDIRSNYHLTLGDAIKQLTVIAKESPYAPVVFDFNGKGPHDPDSYRGYYADLALDFTDDKVTASKFLDDLKNSLNGVFQGYKGGDYKMGEDTPLWAAEYGCTGPAIMGIKRESSKVVLITKDAD
jgi:hypothetical protein